MPSYGRPPLLNSLSTSSSNIASQGAAGAVPAAPAHYNDLLLPIRVPSSVSLNLKPDLTGTSHCGGSTSDITSNRFPEETATPESTAELLETLLSLPNSTPPREFTHHITRLRSVVPSIHSAQQKYLQSLSRILRLILVVHDKPAAKEELVRFMMTESGVASWATSLKRVIDGCDVSSLPVPYDGVSRPASQASWIEITKEDIADAK
ncbi:uncharacterized protein V1518DRAFT_419912 [Limtongia smithiae]|uniref:uncharacterized protein n=1 Tax=Limtongia smithiae TaxID=1125753 RepID=UPI0034CF38E3